MEKKFEYSPEDIHTIVKSLCLEDELDGTLSTIFSAFIDGRMESDFFYGSKRVCEILETYKTQISCLFALNRLPSLESRDIQKHIPDLNKVFDGLQNIELGYYEEERCYIKLTKAD